MLVVSRRASRGVEDLTILEADSLAPEDNGVLLLDDDELVRSRIARALASRGLRPILADTCEAALAAISAGAPPFAVIEPRLASGSGLRVVEELRSARPDCRIVVVTAYGSFAMAVAAVKAGAVDVLPKPADANYVAQLLCAGADEGEAPPPGPLMSPDRVRWEHITRVYEQCDHNVSETARRLGMHRRTLQRILGKRRPR
jgi:two-component system response regulator RegA